MSAQTLEDELAQKWAPVLRLQVQEEECGDGEPYEPIDMDAVLGNVEVAFRGPWDRVNLVSVGPSADEISEGFTDYHLDFPGDALNPGCDYEKWGRRITEDLAPTAYARVVTEPEKPGQLALQYWFYYVFNDFNNLHEGDWEMIQLNFAASGVEEALDQNPTALGYSQHSGAEKADWGEEKLAVVDGTHPVVYPAAGSHANYFTSTLFLGRSAAQGVGCDDTTGPSRDLRPQVRTIPTEPEDYLEEYEWLGFEGRWGELQPSFFNGPTGPNEKRQWTEPISWSEDSWRDKSFAAPAATLLGNSATDFFCEAVEFGSGLLTQALRDPLPLALTLLGLAGLIAYGAVKTQWEPGAPLRLERRRAWGQIVSASRRMYWTHKRLFAGIGLVFIPLGAIIALFQALIFRLTPLSGALDSAGESNTFVVTLALLLGLAFNITGLAIVQVVTARAMVFIDEGGTLTAREAYHRVNGRIGSLVGAVVLVAAAVTLLFLSVFLVPIGIWLLARWMFANQAVELEGRSAVGAIHRSATLVKGHWWRTAAVGLTVNALGLLVGPLIGALLLFVTDASFHTVNLVAALIYTVTIPFVAIVTCYLYFDVSVRQRLEADVLHADVLPKE